MFDTITKFILVIFALFGMSILLGILMAWPVELLWNACLVPAMTGVHEITLLQAWGLNILCAIMFKSVGTSSKD